MNERKAMQAMKAAPVDDDAFRLLAIPFGGPIPSPKNAKGVDLDGEFFTERTDLKLDWLPFRLVDWHHRKDRLMGSTILGKAVDPEMDEDGWWVTVWMKHGERRVDLVKRLSDRATIYGSSEAVPGMARKADTGEITVWPYMRQTLSTSPQNTLSVLRPLKATLEDLAAEDAHPTAAFFDDLATFLDDLASDPASVDEAKAGRVLAGRNEARLREAYEAMDEAYFDPKRRRAALRALKDVLDELERYVAA